MPEMQTKLIDIVIDCPDCGERIALPPVYVIPKAVREPSGTYLTAELGDVPREYHVCRAGVRVVPTVLSEADMSNGVERGLRMERSRPST